MKKIALLAAACAVAFAAMGVASPGASAQTVTVQVTQVRASNNGPESVDPGLGERIKRQYPGYRSYKRVGSDTQSGTVGQTLRFGLTDGMSLTLELAGVDGDLVSMRAAVTGGRGPVVNTTIKVKSKHTCLIGVPLGGDKLILAIGPR